MFNGSYLLQHIFAENLTFIEKGIRGQFVQRSVLELNNGQYGNETHFIMRTEQKSTRELNRG